MSSLQLPERVASVHVNNNSLVMTNTISRCFEEFEEMKGDVYH